MVVIALTGKPSSGTSTISRKLSKKLGLDYFSPGEFFKKHSKLKIQTEKALDIWKSEKGKSKHFHELIERKQIEKAKKGNVVICGKLSIYMLKDLADVKIWLDCSLDERARRTSERDGISFEEAKQKLKEREMIERDEWKRIYGFDRSIQKEMADVVVDSTNLSKNKTVKIILDRIENYFSGS